MIARRMRGSLLAVALAAALALAGCAPAAPAPDAAVSAQLEQTVLVISEAVAGDDWTAADRALEVLEGQVEAALAAGGLTAARADEIRAAIAVLRADVEAALDQPVETPSPTPSDENDKPGNRGGNDKNEKDD